MARRRRVLSLLVFVLVSLTVGGFVAFATHVGVPEEVIELRAVATITADGDARVHETILYRFPVSRHGIFRIIPDLPYAEADTIRIESDHTDRYEVSAHYQGVKVTIGDPNKTVTGAHRYEITYPLDTIERGRGRFGWNGVGTLWTVPVSHTDLDLIAPWRWENLSCHAGNSGSEGGCTVRQPEPGRLEVSHGPLESGEGLTIEAERGAELPVAPQPRSVDVTAFGQSNWYDTPLVRGGSCGLLALITALAVAEVLRRAGRDQVQTAAMHAESAADVAFAPYSQLAIAGGTMSVDDSELAGMSATLFIPPRGLEPWQGAVLMREKVDNAARVAWLMSAAIDGAVVIDDSSGKVRLLKGTEHSNGDVAGMLDEAFSGRDVIKLGKYDPSFGSMWRSLTSQMKMWFEMSRYVDRSGAQREKRVTSIGLWLIPVAIITVVMGLAFARQVPAVAMGSRILGAVLIGAACAAISRAWELRVRTPAGSAMWLQLESFRHFLAGSEAEHVKRAAEADVLREYTAWAVALGEVKHWTKAVEKAGLDPSTLGVDTVRMTSSLTSAARSTGTAPSSSSSSGSGSGGGGGGGGSW